MSQMEPRYANVVPMMCISVAVLLVAGCAAKAPAPAPPATQEWKDATSAEWGFSVSLPGTPRESTTTMKNGKPQFNFILNFTDPIYVIAANAMPAGADRQADKLLEAARDSAVNKTKGTLLSDKPVDLPPRFRGREYLIQTGDGSFRRDRTFIANDRLYLLTVTGTKAAVTSADADRVLESFKITTPR